jgi:hypothetical protein
MWTMERAAIYLMPAVLAVYMPTCAPAVRPTMMPLAAPVAELWQPPDDLATRDLYDGPWGKSRAPDPGATYTFVGPKRHGVNPGLIVADEHGREWHVKQAPHDDEGLEGPVEGVLWCAIWEPRWAKPDASNRNAAFAGQASCWRA